MFHEPFVLFGYLAGQTERIGFLTGIIVLPQRQTPLVAKQAAQVDVLSGGRLRLGVGIGWNADEFQGMSVTQLKSSSSVRDQVSEAEWQARVDLAAAHRGLAYYGVADLTYNHLSVRVPGEPDKLLIKPADYIFEEVTASSLNKFTFDGEPADGRDKPLRGGGLVIHDLMNLLHASTLEAARTLSLAFNIGKTARITLLHATTARLNATRSRDFPNRHDL